jgi:hypothetical protein
MDQINVKVDSYHLQVSTNSDFDTLIVDRIILVSNGTFYSHINLNGFDKQKTYFWHVRAVNIAGNSEWTPIWSFTTRTFPPGLERSNKDIPFNIILKQNYPNPFNFSTTIEFSLPESDYVILQVYNTMGQQIETLITDQVDAGNYKYIWTARNIVGGTYFYQLKTNSSVDTKKLIFLK